MTSPIASAWTSVISQGATQTASRSAPSTTKNPKRSNSLAMEVRVDLSQTGFNDGDALDQSLSIMDCLGLLSCRASRRNGAQRVHLFGVDPAGLAVPKRLGPLEPKADAARGSDNQGFDAVVRRPRLSERPEEACGLSDCTHENDPLVFGTVQLLFGHRQRLISHCGGMEDLPTDTDTWRPLGALTQNVLDALTEKKAADAVKAPAASHGREEQPERWALMQSTRRPSGLRNRAARPG